MRTITTEFLARKYGNSVRGEVIHVIDLPLDAIPIKGERVQVPRSRKFREVWQVRRRYGRRGLLKVQVILVDVPRRRFL